MVRCEQVKNVLVFSSLERLRSSRRKRAARAPVQRQWRRKQEGTAGTRGFLHGSLSFLSSPDFSLFKDVVVDLSPPDRASVLETFSSFHVWTCLFSIASPYRMLLRCWQKAMSSAWWRGSVWLSGELHLSWRVFPSRCRAWRQLTTCRVWGNMPRQSWM